MSDAIKHECGIALLRLLKPLEYYQQKYGTPFYGLHKMYLLLEKQHNRGQEGAGLAALKLGAEPGEEYFFRERAMGNTAIQEVFSAVHNKLANFSSTELADVDFASKNIPFVGEIYMGFYILGNIAILQSFLLCFCKSTFSFAIKAVTKLLK